MWTAVDLAPIEQRRVSMPRDPDEQRLQIVDSLKRQRPPRVVQPNKMDFGFAASFEQGRGKRLSVSSVERLSLKRSFGRFADVIWECAPRPLTLQGEDVDAVSGLLFGVRVPELGQRSAVDYAKPDVVTVLGFQRAAEAT
jgi:hypothetical protein